MGLCVVVVFVFRNYICLLCVFTYVYVCTYISWGFIRRTEDNLQNQFSPFYHEGPGDGTQVARLGGKPLSTKHSGSSVLVFLLLVCVYKRRGGAGWGWNRLCIC